MLSVKYQEQICSELTICSTRKFSLLYDNVNWLFKNKIETGGGGGGWGEKLDKSRNHKSLEPKSSARKF